MAKVNFEVGKRYYNETNGKLELCTKITYQSVYFGNARYNRHGHRGEGEIEYTHDHRADKYCD